MLRGNMIKQIMIVSNARFISNKGKPKGKDDRKLNEAPKKDPEIVMSGKKPRTGHEVVDEVGNFAILSDMPQDLRNRKVARIYQRSKSVMQQGTDNTKDWILEFGTEERWENPTMGWCSSGDPVSNLFMTFPSMCAAICFAEKQGIKFVNVETPRKKVFVKNYSDNFTWNKRTRVSTK